jgi:predicted kinase
MPKITLLYGLPRSGKTTWVKDNKNNQVVISADSLRYLVYNQRFWADGEALMWSIRTMILKYLLSQKVDIVIDETNILSKSRESIIKLVRKVEGNPYWVECIVMKDASNTDLCIERAKSSGMDDLVPVITRMTGQLELPDKSEGIDEIYFWNK